MIDNLFSVKHFLFGMLCLITISCANISPSFSALNERNNLDALASEYGQGEFYFFFSSYKFSNIDDVEEREEYLNFVHAEAIRQGLCSDNFFEVFMDTLRWMEGARVQVLTKCQIE